VTQRSPFDTVCRAVIGMLGAAALVTACGGGHAPGTTQPATSARETVTAFMRAVADSNLTKMAELWGSSKGSAARTGQPSDYEKRIVVMQSFLRNDDYRVASEASESSDRRAMQIELRRQACTWTVPFTVLKANDGAWLVSSVDLTRAGNPVRPCDPDAQAKDSTAHP